MGSLSENCFTSFYADDLLMYKIISDPGDYTSLQSDVNSVADWIDEHYLSLNHQNANVWLCQGLDNTL